MSKRTDIINATMTIIAQQGIIEATIGNILKKAGTGYGTLYNYFDSKAELYTITYVEIIRDIDQYVKKGLNKDLSSLELLEVTLHRYLDYCLDHITAFFALEALRNIPEVCQLVKAYDKDELDFFRVVEKAEEEGFISKRDPFYNMNVLSGMVTTFIRYYNQVNIEITEDKKTDLINSCIKALS